MHFSIMVCKPGPQNASMHHGKADPREIIRKLMEAHDIQSETELAHRADVDQSTVNRYMSGKTAWLSTRYLVAIANCLGVTTSQLLGEVPLDADPKTAAVLKAMQTLPEYLKDIVVATSQSLAEKAPKDPPKH